MLFNTLEYAVFLAVVLAAYYALSFRRQNLLLLVAGYVFYGWWDWRFLFLLVFTSGLDFYVGRWLGRETRDQVRKRVLLVSLGVNLAVLAFFKYFNFFIDSAATSLEWLGLEPHLPTLQIILPVGISFYTFQSMAYAIDVYRRRTKPCEDLLLYLTYTSFFPQLVAGPIERADALLPQLGRPRQITIDKLAGGAQLILIGLFRKVAIADFIAGEVDAALARPDQTDSVILLRGVLLFTIQIYGDFAGYSDIARGTARLLGIELMENFNQPYFATNITTFWRRWHISLSTWLRDYLYVPLGGNRGSEAKTYRNLMLTMLLGGLWHGAAWTFVIWGAIHGVALSAHRLMMRGRKPDDRPWLTRSPLDLAKTLGAWAVTMTIVMFAWIFFRSPSLESAIDVVVGIGSLRGAPNPSALVLPAVAWAALLVVDVPIWTTRDHNVIARYPFWLRGAAYAAMILAITILREDDIPFIYFQF